MVMLNSPTVPGFREIKRKQLEVSGDSVGVVEKPQAKPAEAKPDTPIKHTSLQLPKGWGRYFSFVLAHAMTHPLLTAWPTTFLAAYQGSTVALDRLLVATFLLHERAKKDWKDLSLTERQLTNAMLLLVNKLAERIGEESPDHPKRPPMSERE